MYERRLQKIAVNVASHLGEGEKVTHALYGFSRNPFLVGGLIFFLLYWIGFVTAYTIVLTDRNVYLFDASPWSAVRVKKPLWKGAVGTIQLVWKGQAMYLPGDAKLYPGFMFNKFGKQLVTAAGGRVE